MPIGRLRVCRACRRRCGAIESRPEAAFKQAFWKTGVWDGDTLQPDAATTDALHGAFQGAFQDAQRFRPARRALIRRTTPSATMAAVEISGVAAATESSPKSVSPLSP